METKRLERGELYRRVWETPLRTLAREYGISDVALKKHCVKLRVPTPGLGYWAKRAAGKTPRRVPLPAPSGSAPTFTEIIVREVAESEPAPNEGPIWEQEQFEADEAHRIIVADTLDGASRVIRHTRAILRKARLDERGAVRPYGAGCLDVSVSRGSVDRALRILDAFVKACAQRDFAVALSKDGKPGTTVTLRAESLGVCIVEQFRRQERKAPNPPRRPNEYTPLPYPRYEYLPTGRLTFRIVEYYAHSVRCSWADGAHQRVEDCLNDIMVGLAAAAEAERVAREAVERQQREWAEQEQLRLEQARQRELEERRWKQLLYDCEAWELAARLRDFADAVERDVTHSDAAASGRLPEWVAWVRRQADEVDPLQGDVANHLTREPSWAFAYGDHKSFDR